MGYTLKYESNNGHTILLHDTTIKAGRQITPILSHQTGLTGVDIEFTTAQNGVGSTIQGYSVNSKDITIEGNIVGDSHQYAMEMLQTVIPGVDGRLIYNDTIFLDVSPRQTPQIGQFGYNANFLLVLYAPYPYWKDLNETVIPMERVVKMFQLPADMTEFQLGAAYYGNESVVNNEGQLAVPVKAKLLFLGNAENPYVENLTTGQKARVEGSFFSGETLTIDATNLNLLATSARSTEFSRYPLPGETGESVSGGGIDSAGENIVISHLSSGGGNTILYRVNRGAAAPDITASIIESGGNRIDSAISPNGRHIAVNAGSALRVYKNAGGSFDTIYNATTAGLNSRGCAFSPKGDVLAVVGNSGLQIYQISGDTYTPITKTYTSGLNRGCFSPDGSFFFATGFISPYVFMFAVSGTTFTPITATDEPASANSWACTATSNRVVVFPDNGLSDDEPIFYTYDASGMYADKGIQFSTIESDVLYRSAAFSKDGHYLIGGGAVSLKIGNRYESFVVNRTDACGISDDNAVMFLNGSLYVLEDKATDYPETQNITIDSDRVFLEPGANSIKMGADEGGDDITGEIIIRQEYQGAWQW